MEQGKGAERGRGRGKGAVGASDPEFQMQKGKSEGEKRGEAKRQWAPHTWVEKIDRWMGKVRVGCSFSIGRRGDEIHFFFFNLIHFFFTSIVPVRCYGQQKHFHRNT
jgi:hypothetical protein